MNCRQHLWPGTESWLIRKDHSGNTKVIKISKLWHGFKIFPILADLWLDPFSIKVFTKLAFFLAKFLYKTHLVSYKCLEIDLLKINYEIFRHNVFSLIKSTQLTSNSQFNIVVWTIIPEICGSRFHFKDGVLKHILYKLI